MFHWCDDVSYDIFSGATTCLVLVITTDLYYRSVVITYFWCIIKFFSAWRWINCIYIIWSMQYLSIYLSIIYVWRREMICQAFVNTACVLWFATKWESFRLLNFFLIYCKQHTHSLWNKTMGLNISLICGVLLRHPLWRPSFPTVIKRDCY